MSELLRPTSLYSLVFRLGLSSPPPQTGHPDFLPHEVEVVVRPEFNFVQMPSICFRAQVKHLQDCHPHFLVIAHVASGQGINSLLGQIHQAEYED